MIRAVLDTNVLISYLLTKGQTITRLLDHWERKDFIVLASPQIIAELERVTDYPRLQARIEETERTTLIQAMRLDAEQVPGKKEARFAI